MISLEELLKDLEIPQDQEADFRDVITEDFLFIIIAQLKVFEEFEGYTNKQICILISKVINNMKELGSDYIDTGMSQITSRI